VKAGSTQIFGEASDADSMTEHIFLVAPKAGDVGRHDGVPVIAVLPEGYEFDRSLTKIDRTLSAAWSAQWNAPSEATDLSASLQRAYLGWSYAAPTTNTKTARLHPNQEACVRLEAPFRGTLHTATLFTLVDKMGISSVSLAMRSVAPPHPQIGNGKMLFSASPGVADPGTHRFDLASRSPLFGEAEHFFLCVGIGKERTLPADPEGTLPFLHLPLTNVSTAGQEDLPGATKLIVPPVPDEARAFQTTGPDPWQGHTFVIRAEFVAALDSAALKSSVDSARSTGFLATGR